MGDDGEQWALAAVLAPLLALEPDELDQAIDDVVALLKGFEGSPVETALGHAELARARDL